MLIQNMRDQGLILSRGTEFFQIANWYKFHPNLD